MSALDAFECVMDKYIKIMQSSSDVYLKERYLDFLDIKTRVLQNLNNQTVSLSNLEECILLVEELFPSLLLNISKNVKGIIAKKGGFTSHSAIMCRDMSIPYVIADFPDDYQGKIIIDGETIYLNPSPQLIKKYENYEINEEVFDRNLGDIKLWANIINNDDISRIPDDFVGIGLYRTEFILANPEFAFDIEKQTQIYEDALTKINDRIITFRIFDIGDDKKVDYLPIFTKGVKNYYAFSKLFENQIISILKASKNHPGKVRIMFPMIESFNQYQDLKKVVVKLAKELHIKIPPIGMMLETQGALIKLKEFKNVDFISVGTNDLCSELFNISRDEVILFDDLYEDLLKILDTIIQFCDDNKIPVSVCGELISKTEFAKKAIGLGLKNISISSVFAKNIYKAVNGD